MERFTTLGVEVFLGGRLRSPHEVEVMGVGQALWGRHIVLATGSHPQFTAVYTLGGNIFYEVPGLLGGDLKKAEEMFRKGLERDPQFTAMRVGLGKTLLKLGRVDEAQRELQAVLDEKEPSNPADWTLRDTKEARELLESINRKS